MLFLLSWCLFFAFSFKRFLPPNLANKILFPPFFLLTTKTWKIFRVICGINKTRLLQTYHLKWHITVKLFSFSTVPFKIRKFVGYIYPLFKKFDFRTPPLSPVLPFICNYFFHQCILYGSSVSVTYLLFQVTQYQ